MSEIHQIGTSTDQQMSFPRFTRNDYTMLTLISRFAKLLACLSGIILIACGNQDDAVVSIALHPTNPKILYVATNCG